ncbi:MAG: hypothetical protein J6K43_01385, partial [Lachnospiraceae bacterium]|nr:hypothetical protein [Lachnospiraceae bacterium]
YNNAEATDIINYCYDSADRLVSEMTMYDSKAYTYDSMSNLTKFELEMGLSQITQNYTYDELNRLTGTDNGDIMTSYSYDANGNITGKISGGFSTGYVYNKAKLLTGITNSFNGTRLSAYSYQYNLDGNRNSEAEAGGINKSYSYDGLGRLVTEQMSGDAIAKYSYEYDSFGNRSKIYVDDTLSKTYEYDLNNRLIAFTNVSDGTGELYNYDNNGNRVLSRSFSPGSQSEFHIKNSDTDNTYTVSEYDMFNRLTSVWDSGNTYTYSYYADGLRSKKTVNGSATVYTWCGDKLVGESGINDYFYEYDPTGGISYRINDDDKSVDYYLKNGHGDVTSIYTAAGTPVSSYRYDAFGNQLSVNENDTNPFRYCGEYYDAETQNIYLRNRYYDPANGRFITEDPVRDGLNWYVYCGNNPIRYVDPSGMIIKLTGTGDEVQSIWQNLKKLTNDELVLTQDRVEVGDGQYELLDSYTVTVGTENSGSLEVGTSMIRRIIGSYLTCYIQVTAGGSGADPIVKGDASRVGIGTGGTIYFNPDNPVNVLTEYKDSNITSMKNIPKEIELGHELIHVLRFMGGNFRPYNDATQEGYGTYAYVDAKGNIIKTSYRMEELETTGISYQRSDGVWVGASGWVTTENALRAEHGYGRRAKY